MRITVNGQLRTLDDGATVAVLVRALELTNTACAVEVNKNLVTRRDHDARALTDGDVVEVVTLVGGG